MNIEQWSKLDREAQIAAIRNWYFVEGSVEPYESLADQAAKALRGELEKNLQMYSVDCGCSAPLFMDGEFDISEICLIVTTSLPSEIMLEGIPSSFLGFSVHQNPVGDKELAFKSTWKAIFANLLGWNETVTEAWIERRKRGRRGPHRLDFHYGPLKLACPTIVRELTDERAKGELAGLFQAIAASLKSRQQGSLEPPWYPDQNPAFDWQRARSEIISLINRHLSQQDMKLDDDGS